MSKFRILLLVSQSLTKAGNIDAANTHLKRNICSDVYMIGSVYLYQDWQVVAELAGSSNRWQCEQVKQRLAANKCKVEHQIICSCFSFSSHNFAVFTFTNTATSTCINDCSCWQWKKSPLTERTLNVPICTTDACGRLSPRMLFVPTAELFSGTLHTQPWWTPDIWNSTSATTISTTRRENQTDSTAGDFITVCFISLGQPSDWLSRIFLHELFGVFVICLVWSVNKANVTWNMYFDKW